MQANSATKTAPARQAFFRKASIIIQVYSQDSQSSAKQLSTKIQGSSTPLDLDIIKTSS